MITAAAAATATITATITGIAAALMMQASPAAPSAPDDPPASAPAIDLAQLPISEATGPRCAIVFAIIGQWQKAGDPRGSQWPDMETNGGREFFVQAMAGLMDGRGLDRAALLEVVARETERLQEAGDDQIVQMVPGCLMVKQSAGL